MFNEKGKLINVIDVFTFAFPKWLNVSKIISNDGDDV